MNIDLLGPIVVEPVPLDVIIEKLEGPNAPC